jgi:hypothetical protein
MARASFWTPERVADLRRFYNLEWTSEQIAAHFGKSVNSIRKAVYANKITSRERHAFIQARRMKGRKDSAATRAKKAEAMRAKHQNPETRAKLRAAGALACLKDDRRKAWATRRGFDVPDHLRGEYDVLRRKHFSAREAGEMLGLVPEARRAAA